MGALVDIIITWHRPVLVSLIPRGPQKIHPPPRSASWEAVTDGASLTPASLPQGTGYQESEQPVQCANQCDASTDCRVLSPPLGILWQGRARHPGGRGGQHLLHHRTGEGNERTQTSASIMRRAAVNDFNYRNVLALKCKLHPSLINYLVHTTIRFICDRNILLPLLENVSALFLPVDHNYKIQANCWKEPLNFKQGPLWLYLRP